jgi:hypothetical protein
MATFKWLFSFFEQQTGIAFKIRSYQECQASKSFRQALLVMLNLPEIFSPIIAPNDGVMRVRFPCPTCKWTDKGSLTTRIVNQSLDKIVFTATCPDHGDHQATLSVDSEDYFDTNTALRDIAKVPGLIVAGKRSNTMPLMIDGRDWSGRWDRCVHIPGVNHLGYAGWELPARIYPPTVTDTLGAKLSKSLYVGDMYASMPSGFADLQDFMITYGEDGLMTLWEHVRSWAQDPAYMDRESYTITYFMLLLTGKLTPSRILG